MSVTAEALLRPFSLRAAVGTGCVSLDFVPSLWSPGSLGETMVAGIQSSKPISRGNVTVGSLPSPFSSSLPATCHPSLSCFSSRLLHIPSQWLIEV